MRWAWFLGGLLASLLLTAWLWSIGMPGFFLFLLFPFIGLAWPRASRSASSGPRRTTCPVCGWSTTDRQARFCPRDGTPL